MSIQIFQASVTDRPPAAFSHAKASVTGLAGWPIEIIVIQAPGAL
jgi:hypothetical protein